MSILIADDEKNIVNILSQFFQKIGYATITAHDGEEALNAYIERPSEIELCILDVMMPKLNGIELCNKIKAYSNNKVPIIILTAKNDDDTELSAFENSADDFVSKPFSLLILQKRVEKLIKHHGSEMKNDTIFEFGEIRMDTATMNVTVANHLIHLTPTEYKILNLLMSKPNQVIDYDTFITSLYGSESAGETKLLMDIVGTLRAKLGIAGKMICNVRGVGYKLCIRKDGV